MFNIGKWDSLWVCQLVQAGVHAAVTVAVLALTFLLGDMALANSPAAHLWFPLRNAAHMAVLLGGPAAWPVYTSVAWRRRDRARAIGRLLGPTILGVLLDLLTSMLIFFVQWLLAGGAWHGNN